MAMQISESKSFTFVIPAGEITFNFNVLAKTQQEAASKMLTAMQQAVEELKQAAKIGSN